jgi:predicted nucleotidyltransferase
VAASVDPLPIFRSAAQRRLLTHIFVTGTSGPWSLSRLSQLVALPLSTVQREVQLLDGAGIVLSQRIGNTRLVTANEQSPFYGDLRSLLTKAFGPAKAIAAELRGIPGVEQAYIFGSWARRYSGEPGPPPQDIDLLVVGQPDVQSVYQAARNAEGVLALEVNPVIVSREEFENPTGLVKRIRSKGTVPVELESNA